MAVFTPKQDRMALHTGETSKALRGDLSSPVYCVQLQDSKEFRRQSEVESLVPCRPHVKGPCCTDLLSYKGRCPLGEREEGLLGGREPPVPA